MESEAVLTVLAMAAAGTVELTGSEALDLEIAANPDAERRARALALASCRHRLVLVGMAEARRASDLEAHGLQPYDALHVACAEVAADVLLTTDDSLVRKARDPNSGVRARVANPLRWVEEVLGL
jgi:predicted nucleic acid-binding protein